MYNSRKWRHVALLCFLQVRLSGSQGIVFFPPVNLEGRLQLVLLICIYQALYHDLNQDLFVANGFNSLMYHLNATESRGSKDNKHTSVCNRASIFSFCKIQILARFWVRNLLYMSWEWQLRCTVRNIVSKWRQSPAYAANNLIQHFTGGY